MEKSLQKLLEERDSGKIEEISSDKKESVDKDDVEIFFKEREIGELISKAFDEIREPDIEDVGKEYRKDLLSMYELLRSTEIREIVKEKEVYQKVASGLFLILKEKFLKEKGKNINAHLLSMEKYLNKAIDMAELSGDLKNIIEILKYKCEILRQQEKSSEADKLKALEARIFSLRELLEDKKKEERKVLLQKLKF